MIWHQLISKLGRSTSSSQAVLKRSRQPRKLPIYLCCYHKVGTALLTKVFRDLCDEFGWTFKTVRGDCSTFPSDTDVVLFEHSLVDLSQAPQPYVGVHLIRDPRDVIVSGYLYHQRCHEKWCINTNFDLTEPIDYPQVPLSQQHRSPAWKRQYVQSLNQQSYQANLLARSPTEGLLFELHHYGAWTIDSMLAWDYQHSPCLELKFETVMADFDASFGAIFAHVGLTTEERQRALQVAARHDLNRMSSEQVQRNRHISSRQTQKWRNYFQAEHAIAFQERFGDALVTLGYESSNLWLAEFFETQ